MSHTPSPPLNHLFNFDITHRKLKNKSHNFKEQTHSNSHERSRISLDEADFECILCFRLYYQPVTLICGIYLTLIFGTVNFKTNIEFL